MSWDPKRNGHFCNRCDRHMTSRDGISEENPQATMFFWGFTHQHATEAALPPYPVSYCGECAPIVWWEMRDRDAGERPRLVAEREAAYARVTRVLEELKRQG